MMRTRLGMLLVLPFLVTVGALAQDDPLIGKLIGTWKINLAKSKYSGVPPPTSGVTKITAVPGGIRSVSERVTQGQMTHVEATLKLDGKDYPYKATTGGKPDTAYDTMAIKKIDEYNYENIFKRKGQVISTDHIVISPDGKTRTLTTTGINTEGQKVDETIVYEKQ